MKTATVGRAIRASAAISPKPEMPISTTAASCSGSMRETVIGTPIWLFRFPSVFRIVYRLARTPAIISLAEVLPTLPVMPTTGSESVAR